ncbi:MAG: BMP family ABC transporter substrate-binding protein [Clostridia bacterium]|nr:BMP family ABC transporter substrate-binding protein [Clostridia bacterium]
MKKLLAMLLTLALAITAFAACGTTDSGSSDGEGKKPVKVGLICLHDENSTYDKNFIDAFNAACAAKGVTAVIKTGVPEGTQCYDEAADMADDGVKLVFADSFGHEPYMIQAAKEFKDVQFFHATGTQAHTVQLANYHNAFASIYEGRYLAGVAAGAKLAEMYNDGVLTSDNYDADGNVKVGYIGAFTYAEVISGYTSWFLGVRNTFESLVSGKSVSMEVQFTGSWYHEVDEKTAANNLITRGAALISQHADSWGAPNACETAGIPNVSYNGSTESRCPNTFIISSRINWQPYFEACIDDVLNNKAIAYDYTGALGTTYTNGSVCLTELGKTAPAEGTQALIDAAAAKLRNKEAFVFDVSTFTVGGNNLTSYMADVDDLKNDAGESTYEPDTEVIKSYNGISYFAESEFRSAPYFDLRIDGITLLNQMY